MENPKSIIEIENTSLVTAKKAKYYKDIEVDLFIIRSNSMDDLERWYSNSWFLRAEDHSSIISKPVRLADLSGYPCFGIQYDRGIKRYIVSGKIC